MDIRIKTVKPTVLFVKQEGELVQQAVAVVENNGTAVSGRLVVKIGSFQYAVEVTVETGASEHTVFVQDIDQESPMVVELYIGHDQMDAFSTVWQPQRHWEVCFVPVTHHDLGYTNPMEDVLKQYEAYYDAVLRYCEETECFPDEAKYRYTVETVWSLRQYFEIRPAEVIERFAKYARAGRIEVSAMFGHVIDAMCSHEELIRALYPAFQLKHQYGIPIETAAIVDIPGLSWGLPTVLSGAGIQYFFAGLPTYFEWYGKEGRQHDFWDTDTMLPHGRPDAFKWEGPDGSSVLLYYQGSYGWLANHQTGPNSLDDLLKSLPEVLQTIEEQGSPFDVARFIHRGVDNYPPDMAISLLVKAWNELFEYPKLQVATNRMFFEKLSKQCSNVGTFRGELPHTDYPVGASSQAKETAINRATHQTLRSAEILSTLNTGLTGAAYPMEQLRESYQDMILYDEHTFGMWQPLGAIQDWNWSSKSHYAYRAAGTAQWMLANALEHLAKNVQYTVDGDYITVFNTLSINRTDIVRLSVFEHDQFDLIDDETGQRVPYQIVDIDNPYLPSRYAAHRYAMGHLAKDTANNRIERDLVFLATDVPSMGYKTYRIVPASTASDGRPGSPSESSVLSVSHVSPAPHVLENRYYRVKLNAQGQITSIVDKDLERELVDDCAGHGFNQVISLSVGSGKVDALQDVQIQPGIKGPVYQSILVFGRLDGCPQVAQEIVLYEDVKKIDFFHRVLKDSGPNQEVYIAFPFHVPNPQFCFEGTDSVIRPFQDQLPGSNTNHYTVQNWAEVFNDDVSIQFSSIDAHTLEFGGLWPCYVSQAHHGITGEAFGNGFVRPEDVTHGHLYSFIFNSNFRTNFAPSQVADVVFRYSMTSGTKSSSKVNARNFGWGATSPLIAVSDHREAGGTLPRQTSFCSVDQSHVFLLAVKRAEDESGTILRFIETDGVGGTAAATLPGLSIKGAFITNTVEENIERIEVEGHAVRFDVKPYGITTLRIETADEGQPIRSSQEMDFMKRLARFRARIM